MRYHGAKYRLAPWIISHFPEHKCYVEPFGGAAGVLLRKERSYAEVYNDIDSEVVNVFRVLRSTKLSQQLVDLCSLTPFSRSDFEDAYVPSNEPVEQARRTLFKAFAGFGSASVTRRSGFRIDSKREYSLASHLWARYPEKIQQFCERLSGVIIENRPAIKVLKQHDSEETLHYVDPPYLHSTRSRSGNAQYQHELTDKDHLELLNEIKQLSGMVVISGYPNELYDKELDGWEKRSKPSRISAFRGTAVRLECVWLNPSCCTKLKEVNQ
jgi:DNA adenine methylase